MAVEGSVKQAEEGYLHPPAKDAAQSALAFWSDRVKQAKADYEVKAKAADLARQEWTDTETIYEGIYNALDRVTNRPVDESATGSSNGRY
jgi:hypothetical protein